MKVWEFLSRGSEIFENLGIFIKFMHNLRELKLSLSENWFPVEFLKFLKDIKPLQELLKIYLKILNLIEQTLILPLLIF